MKFYNKLIFLVSFSFFLVSCEDHKFDVSNFSFHENLMKYSCELDKDADINYIKLDKFEFNDIQNNSVLLLKVKPNKDADDPWIRFYSGSQQFTPGKILFSPGTMVKHRKIICKIIKFTPGVYSEILIRLSPKQTEILKENGFHIKGDGVIVNYISYSKKIDDKKETHFDILNNNEQVKAYCMEHNINLPVINITTENNESPDKKNKKLDSVISLENCEHRYILTDMKANIKVRGNATSERELKPYKIKFKKKQNLLGLHDEKKFKTWLLLRDLHSLIAFNLAEEIFKSGQYNYFSSDSTLVHVFINGKYNGVAVLCEQIQADKGRVNISEPEKKSTDIKTGYLLELQNYPFNNKHPFFKVLADKDYYVKDINGIERKLRNKTFSIESEINSPEQAIFIIKYLNGIYSIIYEAVVNSNYLAFDENYNLVKSSYSSSRETIEAVLDIDSLINMMIFEELIRNKDVGVGSFYLAIDFSVPEGSCYHKLTFESPWDFSFAFDSIEAFPFADYDKKTDTYGKEYGKYYFAGAFQPDPFKSNHDRSNYIFTMMNTQKWFIEKTRAVWDKIGSDRLLQIVEDSEKAFTEGNVPIPEDVVDFLRWRIPYIDENLWLE